MNKIIKNTNTTLDTLSNINLEKLEIIINKEGNKIYQNNDYFKDLHNMMQNKEFRNFYNKYYKNWGEIEVMMMYMKLYESIENEYYNSFNKKISREQILYIVKEIIKNKNSRKYTFKQFKEFKSGNNKLIKNIKNNKKKTIIKKLLEN